MARLTGAEILLECLQREGVEVIFGYPGGVVLPLYDALPRYNIRHILVRHEQGAAHMADGYARASGRMGVCLATSGPGATNLVTGIATAFMDSTPVLAITGNVARTLLGRDGFQEADITGITMPITKHNYLVMRASDLALTVREAVHICTTGRPGPVLIDIPKDVFQEEAEFEWPQEVRLRGYKPTYEGHAGMIRRAAQLINEAKRPIIIAGHGVIWGDASRELIELAEKAQIPVITTFLGIGAFPEEHPLSYGWLGMHGMYYANMAADNADVVIGVGMRFDDRAMGRFKDFNPTAKIIHIDIDPAEIGKNFATAVPIVGHVKNVLPRLTELVKEATHEEWIAWIDRVREEHPSLEIRETRRLIPQYVVRTLYEETNGDATIVTGVGQHQMWAGQHYFYKRPRQLISSGGLGTMGFELPGAIGAQIARPDAEVWAICGDGGFQMTMQELAVVVDEQLPIKIAIFNNGYLGMVRQWQQLFYNKNFMAVAMTQPDFLKIAEAYGIPAIRVETKAEVRDAIRTARQHRGPFLIDFMIDQEENVWPMVPAGAALKETIEAPAEELAR
ncbi:MAG: biosynthetic-type acetolactate synthase large subunit [Chloroflexota bacterium]|nr:biosynthetic-type acetolactate synthase large subunit [Dehalococcoidia bacterium]MDW8046758.1 biosynthetic-type acetolactate synthase large subunit [Chloroflexota bacterium]